MRQMFKSGILDVVATQFDIPKMKALFIN